ncbi:hypothetical protein BGX38DRAFT_1276736 [Terfezia claveryi]|nr:hypothetical protein BGX38DRAFT_1276736 [Terfezia claveryi]
MIVTDMELNSDQLEDIIRVEDSYLVELDGNEETQGTCRSQRRTTKRRRTSALETSRTAQRVNPQSPLPCFLKLIILQITSPIPRIPSSIQEVQDGEPEYERRALEGTPLDARILEEFFKIKMEVRTEQAATTAEIKSYMLRREDLAVFQESVSAMLKNRDTHLDRVREEIFGGFRALQEDFRRVMEACTTTGRAAIANLGQTAANGIVVLDSPSPSPSHLPGAIPNNHRTEVHPPLTISDDPNNDHYISSRPARASISKAPGTKGASNVTTPASTPEGPRVRENKGPEPSKGKGKAKGKGKERVQGGAHPEAGPVPPPRFTHRETADQVAAAIQDGDFNTPTPTPQAATRDVDLTTPTPTPTEPQIPRPAGSVSPAENVDSAIGNNDPANEPRAPAIPTGPKNQRPKGKTVRSLPTTPRTTPNRRAQSEEIYEEIQTLQTLVLNSEEHKREVAEAGNRIKEMTKVHPDRRNWIGSKPPPRVAAGESVERAQKELMRARRAQQSQEEVAKDARDSVKEANATIKSNESDLKNIRKALKPLVKGLYACTNSDEIPWDQTLASAKKNLRQDAAIPHVRHVRCESVGASEYVLSL